jgi:hypothetical protein
VRQALLPLLAEGSILINGLVSVVREGVSWTYFVGVQPVFSHEESDHRSFRMFTAQLVCRGACRQMDIVRAFGVSPVSVKRAVKRYRGEGVAGFYRTRKGRGGGVLTASVRAEAQELLDGGGSRSEVARSLGIKPDTLRKAIHQGRLREAKRGCPSGASDKSERSRADAAAGARMGTACTWAGERMLCALGMLQGAPTRFEACRDVSFGGVLCALPALALNGLFRHLETCFRELRGYYRVVHVVTLLADMALCRIKTAEQLQYHPPGELGRLRGLDRIPEVRTLRRKLGEMSREEAPEKWAGLLSRDWMEQDPESAGVLYVDGHVRVYHGRRTALPRRYVSRDRLCLRGTSDYWVNDALGRPFFVVEKPVDPGLLEVLRAEIVPRLLREVPGQPSREELEENPRRFRFLLVFDRQGYSPAFFRRMWADHRIACVSYHKYPGEPWPVEEFREVAVALPRGETVVLKLAERSCRIGGGKDRLSVREVRKLSPGGHQTSLITTAYEDPGGRIAAWMFSRWAQENFFRYMMQDFAIDLLAEYRTEGFHDPPRVVNPAWRELEREHRSLNSRLATARARYAGLTLDPELRPGKVEAWKKRQAESVEEIEQLGHALDQVKERKKRTLRHLPWDQLPESERFQRLAPSRKRLIDTVKLVAYRAETAMAAIVREELAREDDARALIRDLCRSPADITPDLENRLLRVHVHHMSNPRSNRAIEHLMVSLNEAEITYPGTSLRLVYALGHPP